jgi:hypothetical protein
MLFRHCDPRFPFLWESRGQPPARWHGANEGPVQYLADTPDGAWAEFLRHEEISDEVDLIGVERDLWAIDLPSEDLPTTTSDLPAAILQGGPDSYGTCRAVARRLRSSGVTGFVAPSAALLPNTAGGWRVERGGLQPGNARDGVVVVLFGPRPNLAGWCTSSRGRPSPLVLPKVRHFPAGP